MSSAYLFTNAWREVLAQVFEHTPGQINVNPDWLVNPATRRKLKLDYLYPEIGIAARFTGLTAKGQGRKSDWDVLEDEQRDQTRVTLCQENGVQLAVINPLNEAVREMDGLLRVLNRGSRVLAQGDETSKRKQKGIQALGMAQKKALDLRKRIAKDPDKMMATLAERWRDREAGLVTELQAAVQSEPLPAIEESDLVNLREAQRVVHSHFGEGVVTSIEGSGEEAKITILFDAAAEKTFLARLLTDKLQVMA